MRPTSQTGGTIVTDPQRQSAASISRLLVQELVSRNGYMYYRVADVCSIHYAEACAGMGALRCAGATNDHELVERLRARYSFELAPNEEPGKIINTANHVDANVYGILPLEIYLQTGDIKFLNQGLALAEGQWDDPLPNGLTRQIRFWIDDLYMIACLQVQAFKATGQEKFLDRASLLALEYLRKLQQPNGLFYHGPEAPYYWGRGNGWVAAGLAELLSALPPKHPRFSEIVSGYTRMMSTLKQLQAKNGMWRQLVDRFDSWEESSATAMFAYAMHVGVHKGILAERQYRPACDKAWAALVDRIEPDGRLRDVCAGTGQSRDAAYYLERPRVTGDLHGQAAILWLCAERMRISNP